MILTKVFEEDFARIFQRYDNLCAVIKGEKRERFFSVWRGESFKPLFPNTRDIHCLGAVDDQFIIQNAWAILDRKPEINQISIFDSRTMQNTDHYEVNLILYGVKLGPRNWYAIRKNAMEEGRGETCVSFDPFEKKEAWAREFSYCIDARCVGAQMVFLTELVQGAHRMLHALNIESGDVLWSFSIYENLNITDPKVEVLVHWVQYITIHNILMTYISPLGEMLALEAGSGKIMWRQQMSFGSMIYAVDEQIGFLYIVRTVFDVKEKTHALLYEVFNAGNGEQILQRDIGDMVPLSPKDYSGNDVHVVGVLEDRLYFSLHRWGMLCEVNKFTGEVVSMFKHTVSFLAPPVMYDRKIFVRDEVDDNRSNLLMFEL